MTDLTWREAIIKVLTDRGAPMHYSEIAESIAIQKLRRDLGATPPTSVVATISTSLQNDPRSPFQRLGRGFYTLKILPSRENSVRDSVINEISDETGMISAFGMFWARHNVDWDPQLPRLLGQNQGASTSVDFSKEHGVYLLHDGREVIYVGRATDQPLGIRLRQHTADRLNGRWDRFSWFGVYPVSEAGRLNDSVVPNCSLTMMIVTMEALLIEGLEPPQNRKRGDDFRAVEYIQVEDPDLQRSQIIRLVEALGNRS